MRGRMIDADHAERIGLVHEAVDAAQLDDRAEELAEELLGPAADDGARHQALHPARGPTPTCLSGLRIEEDEMAALGDTADAHEGVRAFVEKRPPVFRAPMRQRSS